MLLLFETPVGFAIFEVLDEDKLSNVDDLWKDFVSAEAAKQLVKLKAFSKFENTTEALAAASCLADSKPTKHLCNFLQAHCDSETLGVADFELGHAIKEELQIDCVHNQAVMELIRGVRYQLTKLITGLGAKDLASMSLDLSRSLARHKVQTRADIVEAMITQAIGTLDDLDKQLNTYGMQVKESYGLHFPELAKIVPGNITYVKVVKCMRHRSKAACLDFSEILSNKVENELKEAAVVSMGSELSDSDFVYIEDLCDLVLSLSDHRPQLFDYLKRNMISVAPNLSALVGELVGARLIVCGGGLANLVKQPGSTLQILGAGKALLRALKTPERATPTFGLIFKASLIGQAAGARIKGKMARALASKIALAVRCDFFGDKQDNSMGVENRLKLEARLRNLEGRELGHIEEEESADEEAAEAEDKKKKKSFNPAADSVIGLLLAEGEDQQMVEAVTDKKVKKEKVKAIANEQATAKKDKKKEKNVSEEAVAVQTADVEDPEAPSKKKDKKKKKKDVSEEVQETKEKIRKRREAEADEEEKAPSHKTKKKKSEMK